MATPSALDPSAAAERDAFPAVGSTRWALNILLIAAAAVLATAVGYSSRLPDSTVASFWPVTGIALAAMVRLGRRIWPGLLLGATLGAMLGGARFALALGGAAGTTLAILAAATALEHLQFRAELKRTQDIVALIGCAMLVEAPIAAFVGTSLLALVGVANASNWLSVASTWWIGDVLGILLVAPLALHLTQPRARWKGVWTELLTTKVATILVCILVFRTGAGDLYPVKFLLFPVALWAALRSGVVGVSATNLVVGWFIFAWAAPGPGTPAALMSPAMVMGSFLLVLSGSGLTLTCAVAEAKEADRAMRQSEARHRNTLERRVVERTAELRTLNAELESFSYSVAHDLRGPLRTIGGFAQIVLDEEGSRLREESQDLLHRVHAAAVRMGRLVDSLLSLSRINRSDLQRTRFDISAVAREVATEINEGSEVAMEWRIQPELTAFGDSRLVRLVIANLFENAVKFSSPSSTRIVEFGEVELHGESAFYVRDHGVGFDPAFADKLFLPFHRLHSRTEFEGEGIGLATAERIIRRHGGRIWAEGEPGVGATFYFTVSVLCPTSEPDQPSG